MHHKNELTIQIIAKKNNKGVLHIVHGDGAHVFNLFLSLSLSLSISSSLTFTLIHLGACALSDRDNHEKAFLPFCHSVESHILTAALCL